MIDFEEFIEKYWQSLLAIVLIMFAISVVANVVTAGTEVQYNDFDIDMVNGGTEVQYDDFEIDTLSGGAAPGVACEYASSTTIDGETFTCDVFKVSNSAVVILKNSVLHMNQTWIFTGSHLERINSTID